MIIKRLCFPILFLTIVLVSLFYSCKKEKVELKNPNFEYNNSINKGFTFYDNQKYDSAFYYFYKAKLACASSDLNKISYALYLLAEIQYKQGDFAGSESSATEALSVNPNYENITSFYTLLGLTYHEQYNYGDALKYYNLAYKITTSEKEKNVLQNNIGYIYLDSGNHTKAKTVLEKIISNDSLQADTSNYAKVLDNLGYTYFKLKDPKSISFLNKSLQLRDSLKNDFELIASYMHLSEYYQEIDTEKARDFAQKAYNAATIVKSPDDRIEALTFLITSNTTTEETKKLALHRIQISDNIIKVRQIAKNQFAKIKYDSKKTLQVVEKFKSQKQVLIIVIILLLIIALLLYVIFKSKNKRKLQNNTYKTETRIAKKLHDELANDVFNAMTFAETQDLQDVTKREFLLDNLDTIYTRTRNIAKENSEINTGNQFQENLLDMIGNYISNDVSVITQNSTAINWLKIKKETKITVYRIVQELLVNMKKHSQCSVVIIGFETHKSHIEISYSDNGIGTSEMLKFKNGLQNAENRILAINGTLTFETQSGKGFKAKIIAKK